MSRISDDHKIAYKRKDAPGEPLEVELYRDKDGHLKTVLGQLVMTSGGNLSKWITDLVHGISDEFEGHIIEPPFVPQVGMIVNNTMHENHYYVCIAAGQAGSRWIHGQRQEIVDGDYMEKLVKNTEPWEIIKNESRG